MVAMDELVVADEPGAWVAAGFDVAADGVCRVGSVGLRLIGADERRGLVGWTLSAVPDGTRSVDGVPTTVGSGGTSEGAEHPNGVRSVDHVVLASPHLARTTDALAAIGVEPRREREGELGGVAVKQIFYRFGGVIVEVVGDPIATGSGPASLWGVTFTVADIDATAEFFGDRVSRVKDAVQPGRRIATLRHRDLDLSVRIALISSMPRRVATGGPDQV